jgi:hypothetical protein
MITVSSVARLYCSTYIALPISSIALKRGTCKTLLHGDEAELAQSMWPRFSVCGDSSARI